MRPIFPEEITGWFCTSIAIMIAAILWTSNALGLPITSPSELSPNPIIIDFEDFETNGQLVTPLSNPVVFGDVTFTSLTGSPSIFDISLSGGWPNDLSRL